MPAYLDCNATTPVEPRVQEAVIRYLGEEMGNAGSRTHEFGVRAKHAVERAREQTAQVVGVSPDEVIFTSGATESNNLAILGLVKHAEEKGRKHIVTTAIEHKAVLEPMEVLAERGFEVEFLLPTAGGWVDPEAVVAAVRPDTVLVSVMQANNETGICQPIAEIATLLSDHPAYLHVDAAQGFGKEFEPLQNPRVDLISVSGHKIYGPKGVGALITRRRIYSRPPLSPLFFGGGQERGLRPGTLPVPLIAGLGLAAELAVEDRSSRREACEGYRQRILQGLAQANPLINGDAERMLPHVLNVSFEGVDSEALILTVRDLVAISNGSACTSHSYQPSHVLRAMGLPADRASGAIRISWSHLTEDVDWNEVAARIEQLR